MDAFAIGFMVGVLVTVFVGGLIAISVAGLDLAPEIAPPPPWSPNDDLIKRGGA